MTTLFYALGACSLAPHITLEWIGKPYEAVRVNYGSPRLLEVNAAGAVPTLREDDGWTLTQAGAILDYLAEKHPEAELSGGQSPREKAEAHRWSSFLTSDMHAAFWPVFMPGRYTTDQGDAAKEAVVAAGQKLVARQMTVLNTHLDGRHWMLGEGRGKRSVIDAYAFPMIRWGMKVLPNGVAEWANVVALHDRLAADPVVQKVLADEAAAVAV